MGVFQLKAPPPAVDASRIDADVVREAIKLFADPTAGMFVQGLPWAHWETIDGGDVEAVFRAVCKVAGERGTYFGLNPCPVGENLTNKNAIKRRWLLFDFDAATAHAEKRNATNEERELTQSVACEVAEYLSEYGWPLPVMNDSGNGTHLLYRIDLDNDNTARQMVAAILNHVAALYDAPGSVEIGKECFDARRICKLPGTWANRGGEKEGRFARIVTVPTFVEVVPVELLEMVAAKWKPKETPQPERPTAPPRERGPVFNLRAGGASGDMRAYARKALENESARVRMCPAGGSGGRNITLNDAAFRCGTMVGAGWITDAEIETELTIAAHVCGLMDDPNDGAKKTLDTIRRGIRDGREHPREQPPERNGTYTANGTAGTSEATADEPEKSPDPTPDEPEKSPAPTPDNCITITLDGEIIEENTPEYYTAQAIKRNVPKPRVYELLSLSKVVEREWPEPRWAIPGLLCDGLNLLVGSPKMGKSVLSLNLAMTIAGGGKALDDIQTQPGDVLYLSLEDQFRRIKFRAHKMATELGRPGVFDRLTVATEWPRVDQGGLHLLDAWRTRKERPTLIVIDVLRAFRRPSSGRKENAYDEDYNTMSEIKRYADEHGVSVMCIHHTRKAKAEDRDGDIFDRISGSQGLAAASDGVLLLTRSRCEDDAELSMTGRDMPERTLAIGFLKDSLTWISHGDAAEKIRSQHQQAIVDYLSGLPRGTVVTTKTLATAIKKDEHSTRTQCGRLKEKRMIDRVGSEQAGGWVFRPAEERLNVDRDVF